MKDETPLDGVAPLRERRGTTGGSVSRTRDSVSPTEEEMNELECEAIEYFVSFVQMFGLQKSIGQIYGLLFVSVDSLVMEDIIVRLGISKGSASQGLSVLKGLGAVTSHSVPNDRREHFRADLNVSRIVSHFVENRLQPRLKNGEERLAVMLRLAQKEVSAGGGVEIEQRLARILALKKWQSRGAGLLPFTLRWLKD